MINKDSFESILKYAYATRDTKNYGKLNSTSTGKKQAELINHPNYNAHIVYYYFIKLLRNYLKDEYKVFRKSEGNKLVLNSYSKHLGQMADLTGIIYNTFGVPILNVNRISNVDGYPDDYLDVINTLSNEIKDQYIDLELHLYLDNVYMIMTEVLLIWVKKGYKSKAFKKAYVSMLTTVPTLLSNIKEKVDDTNNGNSEIVEYYQEVCNQYNQMVITKEKDYYDFMYLLMGVPKQLIPSDIGKEFE